MNGDRDLDLALFGVTGFVGRLVGCYLARHAPTGMRIGLAGRSMQRLAEARTRLGDSAADWPLRVADLGDAASLTGLASATRLVVTTVGPYRPQGLALVEACARAGTDYADLSGEVLFMRDSIDRCHEIAARRGARIVHACGVDSIPSDLGVLLLHQTAQADGSGDLQETTMVVTSFKGGLSGGTVESIRGQLVEMSANPASRRVAEDPYALSPDRDQEPELGDQRDLMRVVHDRELSSWIGPFIMAGVNARVVRRSNALQGWAYGRGLRYREVMGFGGGLVGAARATVVTVSLLALVTGLRRGPTRTMLDRVLPAPGEGPSEERRSAGSFRMEFHARTSGGARYVAEVAASGDPGYAATSAMLGQIAFGLVLDREGLPEGGGVLTPVTAMRSVLVDRMQSAGVRMSVKAAVPD